MFVSEAKSMSMPFRSWIQRQQRLGSHSATLWAKFSPVLDHGRKAFVGNASLPRTFSFLSGSCNLPKPFHISDADHTRNLRSKQRSLLHNYISSHLITLRYSMLVAICFVALSTCYLYFWEGEAFDPIWFEHDLWSWFLRCEYVPVETNWDTLRWLWLEPHAPCSKVHRSFRRPRERHRMGSKPSPLECLPQASGRNDPHHMIHIPHTKLHRPPPFHPATWRSRAVPFECTIKVMPFFPKIFVSPLSPWKQGRTKSEWIVWPTCLVLWTWSNDLTI